MAVSGHQSRYTLHSLCNEEYIMTLWLYDSQWTEDREMKVSDVDMEKKPMIA